MLDNTTVYNVAVAPGQARLIQDRLLVRHPQASRDVDVELYLNGEIVDSAGVRFDTPLQSFLMVL